MIDWWWVARNTLWIAGSAILLATYSFRYWENQTTGATSLAGRQFYILGGVLIALGGVLLSTEWWRRGGWLLVIVLLLWMGWDLYHRA